MRNIDLTSASSVLRVSASHPVSTNTCGYVDLFDFKPQRLTNYGCNFWRLIAKIFARSQSSVCSVFTFYYIREVSHRNRGNQRSTTFDRRQTAISKSRLWLTQLHNYRSNILTDWLYLFASKEIKNTGRLPVRHKMPDIAGCLYKYNLHVCYKLHSYTKEKTNKAENKLTKVHMQQQKSNLIFLATNLIT